MHNSADIGNIYAEYITAMAHLSSDNICPDETIHFHKIMYRNEYSVVWYSENFININYCYTMWYAKWCTGICEIHIQQDT